MMKAYPRMFAEAKYRGIIEVIPQEHIHFYIFHLRYSYSKDISVTERAIRKIKNTLKQHGIQNQINILGYTPSNYHEYAPFEVIIYSAEGASIFLDLLKTKLIQNVFDKYSFNIKLMTNCDSLLTWRSKLLTMEVQKPNVILCVVGDKTFSIQKQCFDTQISVVKYKNL